MRSYRSFACPVLLCLAMVLGVGCKSAPPASPPQEETAEPPVGSPVGSPVGGLRFRDSLPDLGGPWAIYATGEGVTEFADLQNGMQNCSAYGASTAVEENTALLYQAGGQPFTGPAFDRNGIYTIIIASAAGTWHFTSPRVVFSGGDAVISFENMVNLGP